MNQVRSVSLAIDFSVQKQIQQREVESESILKQIDQIKRQNQKDEKRWKQLKESAKRLAEEKSVMESHFKREQTEVQNQKSFFATSLQNVLGVLDEHRSVAHGKSH